MLVDEGGGLGKGSSRRGVLASPRVRLRRLKKRMRSGKRMVAKVLCRYVGSDWCVVWCNKY